MPFEELFFTVMARFRSERGVRPRKHKFRFKNKLVSLDSTTISLCLALFPWARFRHAKGGVKAHVLLSHDDYTLEYVVLTEARCSDVKMAGSFLFNPGTIVTLDRGYADYKLFARWTAVYFVTRLKDNAVYDVAEECAIPENRGIVSDSLIRFSHRQGPTGLSQPAPANRRRPPDQPSRVWRHRHHRRYLPRPLAPAEPVYLPAATQLLDNPFQTPPLIPESEQLVLALP